MQVSGAGQDKHDVEMMNDSQVYEKSRLANRYICITEGAGFDQVSFRNVAWIKHLRRNC